MVGDLRRTFIGWLKKTEGELRHERHSIQEERRAFEEEKKRTWEAFLAEKRVEQAKLQDERRRVENEIALSMKQIAVEREDARQRMTEEREKLEREKELCRRQLAMEDQKLVEQRELFEEEKRKIVDEKIAVQTMVELNVGGVTFETSRLTLVQQPGSFLEGLLSGRHHVPRDRTGRIFIDRDSDLFRTLLQFLRNPSVPPCPKDSAGSVSLCNEASYYGIKFFPFPLVFAVGGHNGIEHLASVEVLDVGQECWRPCQPLLTARTYFGCASQQGRLFVFGGQNFEYKALCDSETYDILRDTWSPAPGLNIPRRNTCGAALGARVFSVGGFDGANILSSVEAYDPRMKNWMEVAPLLVPRSSACCTTVGDVLYVIGGTSGERLRTIEKFDARANRWTTAEGGLIEVRSAASCAAFFRSLFVVGGTDNTHKIHASLESLETHSNKWIFRRSLPEPRMDAASAIVSESMMVAGGQNEDVLNSSLFYRPGLDEWREGPAMLFPRYGHGLLVANV